VVLIVILIGVIQFDLSVMAIAVAAARHRRCRLEPQYRERSNGIN
jgi:hypothetical protein